MKGGKISLTERTGKLKEKEYTLIPFQVFSLKKCSQSRIGPYKEKSFTINGTPSKKRMQRGK
jgi:hypothetical protein